MVFGEGSKNLRGQSDSIGELSGKRQFLFLGERGGVVQRRGECVARVRPVVDLERGDITDPLVRGRIVRKSDARREVGPAGVVLV